MAVLLQHFIYSSLVMSRARTYPVVETA